MLIREMKEEDLSQVAEIERSCFTRPWSEQGFRDSIALDYTSFLVAEEKEQIAGYIGMYVSFEEGEITNVAVAPDEQGRGIGQSLVQKIIEIGREKNLERIILEVRMSNASAIHVYEKQGFEDAGIRKNFYEKPKEDARIMICTII